MKKLNVALLALVLTSPAYALSCPDDVGGKFCAMTKQTTGWEAIPDSWGWGDIVPRQSYLSKLTDVKARELVAQNKAKFQYLLALDRKASLPDGTLGAMWLIESMAGTLNLRNSSGYSGHFQFGDYERKAYGLKDPFNFEQAAQATVLLLRDYSNKSGVKLNSTTNAYLLHQQGGTGCPLILKATAGAPLPLRIRKNVLNNVPQKLTAKYGKQAFHLTADTTLAKLFVGVWDNELERLKAIVLEGAA